MGEALDAWSYFDPYEDLAVEIIDDAASNAAEYDLSYSNRELTEIICRSMGWEDFDLFETYDFEAVLFRGVAEELLAYGFVSFLRYRLFKAASEQGVGIAEFNARAMAYSEYWYIRLIERWGADNGKCAGRRWVN